MSSADATTSGRDVLLRARDVTRRFGGLVAVDRVSLELRARQRARGDRHQRRRQVDADQRAVGRAARQRGQRASCAARTSRAGPQPRRARAGLGRSYQRTTIFPQLHGARELPPRRAGAPPAAVGAGGRCAARVHRERAGRARRRRARRPGRRARSRRPARCRTASSASSRSRCAWPPHPRCCCSTSRWPAWAPRRPNACSRCSPS